MSKQNDNIKVFFSLLRAGLWKKTRISMFDDIAFAEIYRLAEEQLIQGLVLQGIEEVRNHNVKPNDNDNHNHNINIPQGLLLQWIGEVKMIEQRNKAMNNFVADLIEKLRKHDIYALLIKGQGIAQCYNKPLWRACGDVDLLLSKDNYEKAKDLLLPLASYSDTEEKYGKHIGLTLDGWSVELHGTQHSELSDRIDKVIDEVQNDIFCRGNVRSWDNSGTFIFMPSPDNDVVFVFTHFIKHYFKEGVGLRQICDWCRLLYTYKDSLNHELLESRIRRAGLLSEWRAFAALVVDYLGMPIEATPLYSAEAKWKKKAKTICDYILEVGNFGHNRDMSYFGKYPYIIRKCISFKRRTGYLLRHVSVFPLDSLRFFPYMMFNGIRSAMRGE